MNTLPPASLEILRTPEGVRCEWALAQAEPVIAERSVSPDDLAAVAGDEKAPTAASLEAAGRLIFSRLLPRIVRDAVFGSHPGLVTLRTDLPGIPWETASDGRRTLGELHAVAREGGQAPPVPEVLRVLMVTDPKGDLPHSATEAHSITQRLRRIGVVRPVTLAGASASRHAVLEMLETRPFDVIHFSCHGAFDEQDPTRSALECFDAPLTVADLAECSTAVPPALCVLNACESGRRGRAIGLPGALRAAGVAAVVAALWPVDNRAATYLSSCLFAELAAGHPVAESLRRARMETRRLFAADPLQTWAAFILEGSPEVTLTSEGRSVTVGAAPLVGREAQWAILDEALEQARAGRRSVVALAGPEGSGRTRLLQEWCSAQTLPVRGLADAEPGDIVAVDDADLLDEASAKDLQVALAHHRGLVIVTTGVSSDLTLPSDTRLVSLPPLERADSEAMLGFLGGVGIGALPPMYPAEIESLGLGLATPNAGDLANALPDDQRMVLRAIALLGGTAMETDIAEVLLRRRAILESPLEALCESGWLVEESEGFYRIRVPANAAAVVEAFHPQSVRRDWGRRAASRLKYRGEYEAAGYVLSSVGDTRGAVATLSEGFRAATHLTAYGVTLRLYRRLEELGAAPAGVKDRVLAAIAAAALREWQEVLRIGASLEDSADPLTANIALVMAEGCLRTGDIERAEYWEARGIDEVERAVVRSEILLAKGDAPGACEAARQYVDDSYRAAAATAAALLELNRYDDAIEVATRGLKGNDAGAQTLMVIIARAMQMSGRYQEAEALYQDLSRALDEDVGWEVAEPYASLLRDTGRLSDAEALLNRAMESAVRRDDVLVQSSNAGLRASVYRRNGRYDRSLEEAERAGDLARSAGLVALVEQAHIHQGTALLEMGRVPEAERALRRALADAIQFEHRYNAAWAQGMLGLARLEAGDPESAEPLLRQALDMSLAHRGAIGESSSRLNLGWASWDRGAPDRASFEAARDRAAAIAYRAVEYPARFALALLDGDIAASNEALRDIESLNMGPLAASLRVRRGEWHARRGEWDAAEEELTGYYRVASRLGMRLLQARAAEGLALAWARTQPERAAEMAAEAKRLRAGDPA